MAASGYVTRDEYELHLEAQVRSDCRWARNRGLQLEAPVW
jgi:hypothetical protein